MDVKVIFIDAAGESHGVLASPGQSLMEAAVDQGVPGIVAECGGAGICSTCHVYISEAQLEMTGTASQIERATLEFARDVRHNSRLCCQLDATAALQGLQVEVADNE